VSPNAEPTRQVSTTPLRDDPKETEMPTTTHSKPEAVLVKEAQAETLVRDPGCLLRLLADADQTGGALTANRSTFGAGADGAPPHFHTYASELFFVLSGKLQVLLDDRVTILTAGDTLVVPPYVPHAFAAAPGHEADVLFVFAPGRERFEYYRLLDRLHGGEATLQEILDTQERFDNHYVESPVWREARAVAQS
jgi:quercetin dioxygenase-like cupin family protein